FATGVGTEHPLMALPILPLAAGVAYSRVHLRVHYPFDVVADAAIGAGMGLLSGPVIRAARRWWDSMAQVPESERPMTSEQIIVVIPSAVRLLARGRISRVDAGRFTAEGQSPRHFVHAAAVGLNVGFARFATRADVRARLGRLTYAAAVALALRERPIFRCELEWEERKE